MVIIVIESILRPPNLKTVCCNNVSLPLIDKNCFGRFALERGQSLVPDPPARITTEMLKIYPFSFNFYYKIHSSIIIKDRSYVIVFRAK